MMGFSYQCRRCIGTTNFAKLYLRQVVPIGSCRYYELLKLGSQTVPIWPNCHWDRGSQSSEVGAEVGPANVDT